MANMTGFNPEAAKQQLEEFKEYGKNICNKASDVFDVFNAALAESWCSPKAKEFQRDYLQRLAIFDDNILTLYNQIYRSAVDAYNTIAAANGWPSMAQDTQGFWSKYYAGQGVSTAMKEASENGVVGMNVANVKLARSIYLDEMKKIVDQMNETPMDIAFYDPEGAQQAAYKNEIQTRITKMNEDINEAMAAIDSAMETEENTILIAKDSAASTMAA